MQGIRRAKSPRISRNRFRAKIRVWRAPMRREGVGRENFYIAKTRDSESVRAVFEHIFRYSATPIAQRSLMLRIEEIAAAQAFLVISRA
jgi:hypothetical protein